MPQMLREPDDRRGDHHAEHAVIHRYGIENAEENIGKKACRDAGDAAAEQGGQNRTDAVEEKRKTKKTVQL